MRTQVEDSSQLEYQAGQEEEEGGSKDKRQPEPQKQQQQPPPESGADADGDADKDGQGAEEEGGVNEDVQDKYEDSHFAPPTAPEQVRALVVIFLQPYRLQAATCQQMPCGSVCQDCAPANAVAMLGSCLTCNMGWCTPD